MLSRIIKQFPGDSIGSTIFSKWCDLDRLSRNIYKHISSYSENEFLTNINNFSVGINIILHKTFSKVFAFCLLL